MGKGKSVSIAEAVVSIDKIPSSSELDSGLDHVFKQNSETFYNMIEKKNLESAEAIEKKKIAHIGGQSLIGDSYNINKRKADKLLNILEGGGHESDQSEENSDLQDEPEKDESLDSTKKLNINLVLTKKELMEKRKKEKEEESVHTVFVGNVAVKTLKSKAFSEPIPKRNAYALKKFHPEKDTCNAYVVFKKKEDAENALVLNGSLFKDLHLRVDLASHSATDEKSGKNINHKNSVFVGNLSFTAKDELLRNHFEECGEINYVRIIRDPKTGLGKGFGYVNFDVSVSNFFKWDDISVGLALKLNNSELESRKLRVVKSSADPKKNKNPKGKSFDSGFNSKGSSKASKNEGTRSVNPNSVSFKERSKNKKTLSLQVKKPRRK
ncbi:Nucleolar protein 12 [Smittium mucronatum]|uniref:Nucleolar protein 12 n=1 Tax=Smittium mucronatum TaxID=133383 RepID=A0A1R0GVC2_9FUNG|nr:Nucleolar protein 12 [Smittium mucronatum]